MSILCQTFVQNAWRSDLCSNCFKSLDDHSDGTRDRMSSNTHRYVPQASTLYQSRCISTTLKWRFSEPLYDRVVRRDFSSQTPPKAEAVHTEQKTESRGILVKNPDRKLRSRSSVDFASEEALVIGYGGNDYDSDLSPWEMGSDDGSIDLEQLDDNEEDRNITKITKNNTEFNSSNQNLLVSKNADKPSENKKTESPNNLKNNSPTNKKTEKSPEKTLNITYNNIQTNKVVSQYYFPSVTENLNPYTHNNNCNDNEVNKNKNNKENSKSAENRKVDNFKRESASVKDDNCKNILNEKFTPLNTQTYSFVSELNKSKTMSSEHNSSDSDYSTCRLTAGDSTDSESFHDADEARIEPCPSFLHGNYPKNLSPSSIRELECDKKYDGGSSTSGDVSNLSDDSDSHESTKRTVYKSKSSKNSKTSIEAYNSNVARESVILTSESSEFQPSTGVKTIQIRVKDLAPNINQSPIIISNTKESSDNKKYLPEAKTEVSASFDEKEKKNSDNTIKLSISSSASTEIQVNKTVPTKFVRENLTDTTTVDTVNEKNNANTEKVEKTELKTPTAKKELIKDNQTTHKQLSKQKSLDSQLTPRQNLSVDNVLSKRNSLNDKSENDEGNDSESSPDTIAHRQSKLAALALELELARRDSSQASTPVVSPLVATPQMPDTSTPKSVPPIEIPAITPKSSCVSVPCSSKIGPLPDVLQETPAKTKKSRFSLKKLLKRNKDSGTITPMSKDSNPKAWKKQSFDRSRLSLEIVHPMDMTCDPVTSGESTPTDDNHCVISNHPGKGLFKSGYSRARSLSALPQIHGECLDNSNCSLVDCRKVETLPARKAGTVAERKKNRPSLVRTPSCSALPNRSQPTTPSSEDNSRIPPPKPPPPPKHKLHHPPPPPPPPHSTKPKYPARPPPPKIPDIKYRNLANKSELSRQSSGDKEYANLGDIRSQLMPKKPERASALSVASRESETEEPRPEEEDPYSYLDETEVSPRGPPSPRDSALRFKLSSGGQLNRIKPWLDLQTSYSAIAATNYESLAELITTSLNENIDYLKIAGKSIKFKDFTLKDEDPEVILPNRIICNAVYKNEFHTQVVLMIFPRKMQHLPPARNQTRYPVLGSFMDYIPKELLISEEKFASVYILQQSRISTIQKFTETAGTAKNDQHIHLRDYCFVLLQLIHTLKSLQAEGIEEVNFDLERLILVTTIEDKPPILVLFPEDKTYLTFCDSSHGKKTLCQATLGTLYYFLSIQKPDELMNCSVNGERLAQPVAHTFSAIAQVLSEEKASSLTQAKELLEYMLWGPVDIKVSDAETVEVIDTVLQRWLDLQRAQMVKSTLSQLHPKPDSSTAHMHVFEEYQLVFLLQASVKSLKNVISKL